MSENETKEVNHIRVKVVFKKGICTAGHKVGQEWIVGQHTPAGICTSAYNSIYPFIRGLRGAGYFEYPAGSGVARLGCPDAWNQVVFELSSEKAYERRPKLPEICGDLEYLQHLPLKND